MPERTPPRDGTFCIALVVPLGAYLAICGAVDSGRNRRAQSAGNEERPVSDNEGTTPTPRPEEPSSDSEPAAESESAADAAESAAPEPAESAQRRRPEPEPTPAPEPAAAPPPATAWTPPPAAVSTATDIPLGGSGYPVNLTVAPDEGQNRLWGIPFVGLTIRAILVIPQAIVLLILGLRDRLRHAVQLDPDPRQRTAGRVRLHDHRWLPATRHAGRWLRPAHDGQVPAVRARWRAHDRPDLRRDRAAEPAVGHPVRRARWCAGSS